MGYFFIAQLNKGFFVLVISCEYIAFFLSQARCA
jgi:hypothetical protein